MASKSELTPKQRKELKAALLRASPDRINLSDHKPVYDHLLRRFAHRLRQALSANPGAEQDWHVPLDTRVESAISAIVLEVASFHAYKDKKVATAGMVGKDLEILSKQLRLTVDTLSIFKKRTRNWITNHAAKPSFKYEGFISNLRALSQSADKLHSAFHVASESQKTKRAETMFRRVALLWFHATEKWPAISDGASRVFVAFIEDLDIGLQTYAPPVFALVYVMTNRKNRHLLAVKAFKRIIGEQRSIAA